jgi:hypothetical protein
MEKHPKGGSLQFGTQPPMTRPEPPVAGRSSRPRPPGDTGRDVVSRLETLSAMHQKGDLTDEEFASADTWVIDPEEE